MTPDLTIGLLGVLIALVAAVAKSTWTLSARLASMEAQLTDAVRRLTLSDDNARRIAELSERLATLEASPMAQARWHGKSGKR